MAEERPWKGTPPGLIIVSFLLPLAVLSSALFWLAVLQGWLRPADGGAAGVNQIPAEALWWLPAMAAGHYLLRNRKIGFYFFLILAGSWTYGSVHIGSEARAYDSYFVIRGILPLIFLALTLPYVIRVRGQLKE